MLVLVVVAVVVAYEAYSIVYNLYFHPLAKIPGPVFWRSTRIGFIWSLVRGQLVRDVRKLHEQYGDIVRTAPDEVSFARKEAWDQIFLPGPGGAPAFYKNPIFFKSPPGQPTNMVTTINIHENQRMRKVVLPAFTERALRAQEPVILGYATYLMDKFQEMATAPGTNGNGAAINVNDWFNFFAFDLIGDLTFGESFGCMQSSSYHPWVKMLYAYLKGMVMLAATRFYPLLEKTLMALIPPSLRKMQDDHYQIAAKKISRRMNFEKTRNDFMTPVLDPKTNPDFENISRDEVESTYQILIIAGSETTATALVGTANYLAQTPDKKQKLVDEIRSSFASADEINVTSTRDLPYLTAVIQEGLRLCNPVPAGLPRCVPEAGATVCGHWLPGRTSVIVSPMAIAHSPKYFYRASDFIPERWLPAQVRPSEFLNDALDSQFPFGLGQRNCPGKLLALTELKIVLAKMMFQFDMDVVPDKRLIWENLRTFIVVEKEPVYLNIKPRAL
ncbi:isotrichodermin C-15 hydroxylase [Massariosphaeria phaeospora]|uniref:Isotrichodermin C-15 hydroxylase n=1 Tax=Massariosphaeria phaeospora TaxID=100035 RepID=A0A7C8ME44_9PLEO|nr:isotrichodermin C-15 hydroxylase [Massariosphaeria phaeospora]